MMEILNRNQRRSAIWRVAALLGVILALLFTILTSMHLSYGNQGMGETEAYSDSLTTQRTNFQGIVNGLVQDTVRLSQEIENLKKDTDKESELEQLRKENEKLEKKLDTANDGWEKCEKEKVILNYTIDQHTKK